MSQNSNFLRIFQTLCLSYLKTTSKGNLSKIEQYLGSKAQKRDHFIDAESIRKPLKIFYLYNHKYYTDESYQLYYLNKIFYLVKSWGVTQSARGHKQKTQNESKNQLFDPISNISLHFKKNCSIYDASSCMSSLAKFSYKTDNILGSSGQNTTKNWPKMIVLLVQKHLKLKKYRSDIAKT